MKRDRLYIIIERRDTRCYLQRRASFVRLKDWRAHQSQSNSLPVYFAYLFCFGGFTLVQLRHLSYVESFTKIVDEGIAYGLVSDKIEILSE